MNMTLASHRHTVNYPYFHNCLAINTFTASIIVLFAIPKLDSFSNISTILTKNPAKKTLYSILLDKKMSSPRSYKQNYN